MPKVKASKRMLKLLGKSTYSDHTLVIATREAVQNAVDAAKSKVAIKIVLSGYSNAVVDVIDDGDGMSGLDIENVFLELGTSGKEGTNMVGNFGVGGAAIMSCESFWIHTRDFHICQDDLDNDAPVRKVSNYQHGTHVHFEIHEDWFGEWRISKMLQLLYFSDFKMANPNVQVSLRLIKDGSTVIDDPDVHIRKDVPVTPIAALEGKDVGVTGRIMDKFTVGKTYEMKSRDVIRINGLVQFTDFKTAHRIPNLVFDIDTEARPGEDDYPLSLSREQLRGALKELIDTTIECMNIDALTTAAKLLGTSPDIIKNKRIRRGHLLQGRRGKSLETDEDREIRESLVMLADTFGRQIVIRKEDVIVRNDRITIITPNGEEVDLNFSRTGVIAPVMSNPLGCTSYLVEGLGEAMMKANIKEIAMPTDPSVIDLLIKNYNPTPSQIRWHAKVLSVWSKILQVVVEENEEFGIGVTSERGIAAQRTTEFGVHYILNVDLALREVTSKEGMVLRLWKLACHENAHSYIDIHNERWSDKDDDIFELTCDEMYGKIKEFAKML